MKISLFSKCLVAIVCFAGASACHTAESPKPEAATESAVQTEAVEMPEAAVESGDDSASAGTGESIDNPEAAGANDVPVNSDEERAIIAGPTMSPDEIPENLIACEVKIQVDPKMYADMSTGTGMTRAKPDLAGPAYFSAMAVAISIEEALDHAVYEACAIPCAEIANDASSGKLSDDEREAAISKCTDACSDAAFPVDAECIQNGQTIFTGGSFNEPAGSESDAPDAG